jgi:hypothetical protein
LFPSVHFHIGRIHSSFDEYQVVVKLTSNDSVYHDPRVISILHVIENKDCSRRFISLTPMIDDPQITYLLPLYRIPNKPIQPTICYIGYFLNSYMDSDLSAFIDSVPFEFIFVVWGDGNYHTLNQKPNVKVLQSISTNHMMALLGECKFVMARKLPYQKTDRFSGAIALGLSSGKPILLQKTFEDLYRIPALTFHNEYMELKDTVSSMSDHDYNEWVKKTLEARDKIIDSNQTKFMDLMNQYN